MATIAVRRAEQIGRQFLSISQVVGTYRYQHYESMSKTELRTFSELHITLLRYNDQFPIFAEYIDVKRIQHTIEGLEKIAVKFQQEYPGMNIYLATKAATLAVQLGAAFLCGDPDVVVNMMDVLNRPWK
jgi:hypothetical protein